MSKKNQHQPGTKRPKGKNAFASSVLHIFTNDPFRAFNYKEVSAKLGIKDKASRDLVNTILVEFLEEGADYVRAGFAWMAPEKS